MKELESIINDVFGTRFTFKVASSGITLISKDESFAFCVGFIRFPESIRIREKFFALKKFEQVEAVLQPVLKKHKISQGDFELNHFDCQFISTIKQGYLFSDLENEHNTFLIQGYEIKLGYQNHLLRTFLEIEKALVFANKNFITRYQKVQDVFDALSIMTSKEKADFLANPVLIREFVISALGGSDQNLEYKRDKIISEYIEAEKMYPEIFKNHDKAASEIFEALNS
jgi:hypothetical protein